MRGCTWTHMWTFGQHSSAKAPPVRMTTQFAWQYLDLALASLACRKILNLGQLRRLGTLSPALDLSLCTTMSYLFPLHLDLDYRLPGSHRSCPSLQSLYLLGALKCLWLLITWVTSSQCEEKKTSEQTWRKQF